MPNITKVPKLPLQLDRIYFKYKKKLTRTSKQETFKYR